jgi:hypothetical protein
MECRQFKSFSGVVRILRDGFAGITADDHGSISMWRRKDTGIIRAGFYRHFATLDERDFRSLKLLKVWLAKWYPRMSRSKASAEKGDGNAK